MARRSWLIGVSSRAAGSCRDGARNRDTLDDRLVPFLCCLGGGASPAPGRGLFPNPNRPGCILHIHSFAPQQLARTPFPTTTGLLMGFGLVAGLVGVWTST